MLFSNSWKGAERERAKVFPSTRVRIRLRSPAIRRPYQTELPAFLLGPGIVRPDCLPRYVVLCQLQQLSVCLPIRPRGNSTKTGTPSASRRVAERRIPPCPHYLTIAILIPFRYFRLKSLGNINHNSRTEPHTIHAECSLTLPNAPAERTTGRPISFSEQAPRCGLRRHRVSRSGPKRRIDTRERGAPRSIPHQSRAGAGRHTELGAAAQCDTETFEQRLNLIRSATVRHREKQTVPSASCASARCTVPSITPWG